MTPCYLRDVSDRWQILRDAGLPLAGDREVRPHDVAAIAAAVRDAVAARASGREADALAAFILAWRGHWPTSFARVLGDDHIAQWAEEHRGDPGRYLKLRRIAIANLAQVL